jgi:hypothetical protein
MPGSSSGHLDVDVGKGLTLNLGEIPDPRSHSFQCPALVGANPIEGLLEVFSVVHDLLTLGEVAEVLGESANRGLANGTDLFEDLAGESPRIEVARTSNRRGQDLDSR